ncbi:response regulator [Marinobacterium jannaschii]|uniref:response regulator n=1 Tax=Marinobacterium jannaschii TaxID=64970 RepID=UPI0004815C66|nr:response regulator [Marinobacterium jannaschii]
MSTRKKPRILFLDDEENVVKGIERLLWRRKKEWDLYFFTDYGEALELIRREAIDIAVVDMKMPGRDGIEILRQLRIKEPHCIRVILSGESSDRRLSDVIDVAHQFLAKPCEPERLSATLERALLLSRLIRVRGVQKMLASVGRLPSIPKVYESLRDLLEQPEYSIDDIAGLISKDPVIAAKTLKVVNTAFFGVPREVSSPQEAVMMLGLERIKALVLMTELFEQVDPEISRRFDLDQIWLRGLRVLGVARRLGELEALNRLEMDYLCSAAMFQDLGELALVSYAPDMYEQILQCMEQDQLDILIAERKVAGADHVVMGAFMLGIWGLPDGVIFSLLGRVSRNVPEQPWYRLKRILHAANLLTDGQGEYEERLLAAGSPAEWQTLAEEGLCSE